MDAERPPTDMPEDAATAARRLLRTSLKASLATIDSETGHPHPSLVLVAAEPDGTPLLLLSRLALHTRNLEKDPRAGLLLDGTDGLGDALSGARVTLTGDIHRSSSPTALRRFLARHPSAEGYAAFADFSVHAMRLARVHFIAGFGRIVGLEGAALSTPVDDAGALVAAEADVVSHMNDDHADAIALYATELAGGPSGDWRMAAIDPEGCDLLHRSNAVRITFPERVRTPTEARVALVALAKEARERRSRKAGRG